MPQAFLRAQMTKEGEKLYARAVAGLCEPEYLSIRTGSGIYSADDKKKETLKERTALKDEKNRYAFSAFKTEGQTLYLEALVTNFDKNNEEILVKDGYYINEIGIYAREKGQTDEGKLVSICVTASSTGIGDYMPPYTGGAPAEITQGYYISIADADNITVNIEQSDHTVMFKVASIRENVQSGERESVLWGKVAKMMNDLKSVAYSANYTDLIDAPEALPANGGTATNAKNDAAGNDIEKTYSKKEDASKIQYDLTEVIFQMSVRSLTDNSKFRNVIVDTIDSKAAVNLVSGSYASGKVYI